MACNELSHQDIHWLPFCYYLTDIPICNNGYAQIQTWKSPFQKLKGELEFGNPHSAIVTFLAFHRLEHVLINDMVTQENFHCNRCQDFLVILVSESNKYIFQSRTIYAPSNNFHWSLIPLSSLIIKWTELQHEKVYLLTCAPNEDSDQTAHLRSLIWVFVVLMKKLCILGNPKCTVKILIRLHKSTSWAESSLGTYVWQYIFWCCDTNEFSLIKWKGVYEPICGEQSLDQAVHSQCLYETVGEDTDETVLFLEVLRCTHSANSLR